MRFWQKALQVSRLRFWIYSCFNKGCPTSLKRTPQCRSIMIAYHCLIEVQQEGKGNMSSRVCAVFFYPRWNTFQLQSRCLKSSLPIIPFDLAACAHTLLWDNLSQNSCTFKMNAEHQGKIEGSCVLKAPKVECRSIPSIDTWWTSQTILGQHSIDI